MSEPPAGSICEVAIVGAGPYGLSIAAHLQERGVAYRIFGQPMSTWQKMPPNTFLKSLGWATDVYLPGRRDNFVAYSRERGLEAVEPCAMHDFARFGIWAQSWAVPNLETTEITRVARQDGLFLVTTSNGETFPARNVIVAVGLTHFAHIPEELAGLPSSYVTHTSQWSDFQSFAGQEVCVIGAGASSLDAAAQLLEVGARPTLLVRGAGIGFSWKTPAKRSLWERIRRPDSALGFGLRSWVFEVFPGLLHYTPDRWRIHIHRTNYGPLGGWWLRDRIEGKVPLKTHCRVLRAEPRGERLALTIREEGRGESEIVCDHVIAGCGYRLDADRLPFLDDDIKRDIRRIEEAPALDRRFESTVPGLFFVGVASSLSFGPLFRFVVGARYTARTLSRVLARRQRRSAQTTPALAIPLPKRRRLNAKSPVNILLLAAGGMMAYKVLRCAAEAAGAVFVLGDQRASRLASSRYCHSFLLCSHEVNRSHAEALADEINRIVAERGISIVVPGDYESTSVLAAIRHKIQTRVFPLPSHELLEELNNKWSFNQLCHSLRIPAPVSSLVADRNELARSLAASQSSTGHIVKPIDQEGGAGFLDLTRHTSEDALNQIDYQPILVQDYVAGGDICISLFCQEGQIRASVVYTRDAQTIRFTRHKEFERDARLIAENCQYTGVLCFDGRLSPSGRVSFIECNPRFWNNMDVAMICGVNFVALGLTDDSSWHGTAIERGVTLRSDAISLSSLLRPWLFSKSDLRLLLYRLRDYRFMLHPRQASFAAPAPGPSC